jgi:hypothetical protein
MNEYDKIDNVLSDIVKFGENNFIVFTGGVGDFLTVDYFFSFIENKNIIFLSKQSLTIKQICMTYNTNEHRYYSIYYNFDLIKKPGFNNSNEVFDCFPDLKIVEIVNILEYFPLIQKIIESNVEIKQNTILTKQINTTVKANFNIPDNFALINPFTEDNNINCVVCNKNHTGINQCGLTRNFLKRDYLNILNFLQKNKIIGVIVSIKPIYIPNMLKKNIINLSSYKLGIVNCIELVKKCKYFFGVDSVFSVIASKILPHNNIYIKCNNNHAYIHKEIYWYPNKNINLQNFINIKC